jgi:hypothetical protein
MVLQPVHQLLEVPGGHVRAHCDAKVKCPDLRDWLEIPDRIISQIVIDVREQHHRRDRREQQDRAVSRCILHRLDAEASRRAGPALHDDRPIELHPHRLRDHSQRRIADTAGLKRQHDPDRGFSLGRGMIGHQAERYRYCNSDHAHGRLAVTDGRYDLDRPTLCPDDP